MNLNDLFLRIRALVAPHRIERELDEELAFHIERETQQHIAAGLSPVDARTRAIARFGPVPLAADQCRDARGTGFIDDLSRDIPYAFRTFRRAPLAALTIVATIALGLGLIAAVFTIYDVFFLRADAVRSPGELFAVERSTEPGDDASPAFTRAEYDAMRQETNVFTDAVAMLRGVRTRIEGRRVTAALVTGNFFDALGVQAALGRPFTPGDDGRFAGRPVIVLSHMGWSKLFAGDPMVIGRSLLINRLPFEIVGVMPEDFRGLGILPPDYWAPLALAGQFRVAYAGREDEIPIEVVGRLRPGISPAAAMAALTVWASGRTDAKVAPGRPASIALRPRQGTLSTDTVRSLLIFSPIYIAFGLILMIGCANVANLLLARGVSRQREIGIRLSIGASRRRIVRQLLTENLLLALVAGAGGFFVSRLFLEGALYAATTTVPPELLEIDLTRFVPPTLDWRVVVFLVAGAIGSTVFFGLVPALQATRLELVPTMRGEVTRGAHPGRARHGLIALQVGASALLLICAAIFLRGAVAASTVEPGLRTNDTMMVPIANESRRAELLQAVMAHPSVATVAALSQPTRVVVETSGSAEATEGRTAEMSSRVPVEMMTVSPEYFDLLDIGVVSGRGFAQAERTAESGVVVVSEIVSRRLWPDRSAVGEVMRLQVPQTGSPSGPVVPSRTFTVVGVVREVGEGVLMPEVFTFRGVYVPAGTDNPGTSLMLRVRGEPEETRQVLLERLTTVDPGMGAITRMEAMAGLQTSILRLAFQVTFVLGGLALVLTVSGLFSVLSYVVEQRAMEIGVRVALGATTRRIAALVLSQSLRPVGIGLVAGGGLAAALAIVLTTTAGDTQIRRVIHVFDPVAYAASLLVIVTSCVLAASIPALRAARIDPMATLRKD
jgi:predicted permease